MCCRDDAIENGVGCWSVIGFVVAEYYSFGGAGSDEDGAECAVDIGEGAVVWYYCWADLYDDVVVTAA